MGIKSVSKTISWPSLESIKSINSFSKPCGCLLVYKNNGLEIGYFLFKTFSIVGATYQDFLSWAIDTGFCPGEI